MNRKKYIPLEPIKLLYESGKSLYDISKVMKISLYFVKRTLNDAAIKTNRTNYFYRQRLRKYAINDSIFENIDTPEKAYILGFLFADGCVNSKTSQIRLKLQEKDKEILDKIKVYLNYDKPLNYSTCKNSSQGQYNLIICNKKIYVDLISHGLTPKKSFTCKFPILLPDLYSHFIRGYFDGDGSIYVGLDHRRKDRIVAGINIVSSTYFCNSLSEYLQSKQIDTKISHDPRVKKGIDQIRIRKMKSIELFYKLIYNNSTIHLERKFNKFKILFEGGLDDNIY